MPKSADPPSDKHEELQRCELEEGHRRSHRVSVKRVDGERVRFEVIEWD